MYRECDGINSQLFDKLDQSSQSLMISARFGQLVIEVCNVHLHEKQQIEEKKNYIGMAKLKLQFHLDLEQPTRFLGESVSVKKLPILIYPPPNWTLNNPMRTTCRLVKRNILSFELITRGV